MTEAENRENLVSQTLDGLVRVGTVTDRQMDKRLVRVWFEDDAMSSGWLPVIISQDVTPDYEYDDPQWTELETEWEGSRSGEKDYVDHKHKIIRKPYMPKVGDQVLAVYLPAEDDPVFMRYYLPVLTASMIAYAFSELAGFLRKDSSPRGFIFAGDLTVVLCLMSIADGNPARILLFAGCALVMSVYLLLCRDPAPAA